MSDTSTSDDPRRSTAATWVAGTGAFLLLVAATVFTAVRWDELPPLGKLGVLCGITTAFLAGGRRLGRTLPATGSAVLHLGTLLVPVDAAAIAVHLDLGWPGVLLAAGGAGAATFPLVGRTLDSVVLRWAGATAVVAAVAGVAGATSVPVGPALAACAVAAVLLGTSRPATAWAVAVGLSPLLVLVPAEVLGGGVLRDLGLAGGQAELSAVVSGALAAFVLGREARRLDDPARAYAAVVALLGGLATTWTTRVPSTDATGLAGAFLAGELLALAVRRDRLWRPVADVVAGLAETIAAIATGFGALLLALEVGWLVVGERGSWPQAVVVFGPLALAWVAADLRRQEGRLGTGLALVRGSGWLPATPAIALCAAVAAASTGSPAALAATLLAVAGLGLVSGRPFGHLTGAVAAAGAPLVLAGHPVAVVVAAAMGAALVAEVAVLRARAAQRTEADLGLLGALAPVGVAAALVAQHEVAAGVLVFGIGAWLVAQLVDRGDRALGAAARLGALAVLLVPPTPGRAALVGAVAVVLLAVDLVRLRDERFVVPGGVVVAYGLVGLLVERGVSRPFAGVGMALAGVVLAGLAAVVDDERWRRELVRAVVVVEAIGLVVSGDDPRALADALVVAGAVLLGGGIALRNEEASMLGAGAATAGVWLQLGTAHVGLVEAYALPLALDLLAVGHLTRRRQGLSSWVAYTPGIAVAGGLPLVARLDGGPGVHGLIAGTVAVVALVVGGHRRLAAPLVLGTVGCVVLTGYESLAVTASVPTWGWLALAGSILLVAGVSIERSGVSPVASGRRLAEVVVEQFD